MTLGERCDEIVRLIDETLEDYGQPATAPAAAESTEGDPVGEPPMVARVRALAERRRNDLARSA
jgi:hypothetical protein